jgi:phosphopantetheinyl transferase
MSAEIHKIHFSTQGVFISFQKKESDVAFLEATLFQEERSELSQFKNEKRAIEFLNVRKLRSNEGINSPIYYNESGKPYLASEIKLGFSISHSKNYCAIGYGEKELGIDIEEIDERIDRISSRFMNEEEEVLIGKDRLLGLTRIWTLKEAMFKLNPRAGIDFKSELILKSQVDNSFMGEMLTDEGWKKVILNSFQLENLVISACSFLSSD